MATQIVNYVALTIESLRHTQEENVSFFWKINDKHDKDE